MIKPTFNLIKPRIPVGDFGQQNEARQNPIPLLKPVENDRKTRSRQGHALKSRPFQPSSPQSILHFNRLFTQPLIDRLVIRRPDSPAS